MAEEQYGDNYDVVILPDGSFLITHHDIFETNDTVELAYEYESVSTIIEDVVLKFTGISESPSESASLSPSASESPSESPSESASLSPSASESPSESASESASLSPSASESPSESPSESASLSPSASESASLSPSASESLSESPSESASESPSEAPDAIQDSTTWGHVTGVVEVNTRTFSSNWTGTGSIENSGDSEIMTIEEGEYMESEVVDMGAVNVEIIEDVYGTGSGPAPTIKYKDGNSYANCIADSWNTYSVPFLSTGYVQIRIEI